MTKGPLASSPDSYQREMLALLACALLMACGLAGWPAPAAAASASAGTNVPAATNAATYAPPASWSDGAVLGAPDTADDSDDDDDDVDGGGAAAITADVEKPASLEGSLRVHRPSVSWISHSEDGHALRGPPADSQDSTDLELFDDDNDDDDLTAVDVVATSVFRALPLATFAGMSPASSSPSSDRAQRAPPISSL